MNVYLTFTLHVIEQNPELPKNSDELQACIQKGYVVLTYRQCVNGRFYTRRRIVRQDG